MNEQILARSQIGLYSALFGGSNELFRITTGIRIGQELHERLSRDEYIELIRVRKFCNSRNSRMRLHPECASAERYRVTPRQLHSKAS